MGDIDSWRLLKRSSIEVLDLEYEAIQWSRRRAAFGHGTGNND